MTGATVPSFLRDLRVGQAVWHWKFGAGVVLATLHRGIDERARVDFGVGRVRWLAVAVARLTVLPGLAAQPPTARAAVPADEGPGPGPTWRSRRRSPTFVEWFRPQVLTLSQCAARASACLRGRPDPALPGRWRRTSVRSSHYVHSRVDGPPWVMLRSPQDMPALEWELCRVANRRTDMRIGFGADSAPVILQTAEWLEAEFALAPQPALWCQQRSGALNGTAFNVAFAFWSMWVAWRIAEHHPAPSAGPFDLINPSLAGLAGLPRREANVLSRLNRMLRRPAAAGPSWHAAQVELLTSADDARTARIGVTLHAASPFGLVRHWFAVNAMPRQAFALPLHHWPDATPLMGGDD